MHGAGGTSPNRDVVPDRHVVIDTNEMIKAMNTAKRTGFFGPRIIEVKAKDATPLKFTFNQAILLLQEDVEGIKRKGANITDHDITNLAKLEQLHTALLGDAKKKSFFSSLANLLNGKTADRENEMVKIKNSINEIRQIHNENTEKKKEIADQMQSRTNKQIALQGYQDAYDRIKPHLDTLTQNSFEALFKSCNDSAKFDPSKFKDAKNPTRKELEEQNKDLSKKLEKLRAPLVQCQLQVFTKLEKKKQLENQNEIENPLTQDLETPERDPLEIEAALQAEEAAHFLKQEGFEAFQPEENRVLEENPEFNEAIEVLDKFIQEVEKTPTSPYEQLEKDLQKRFDDIGNPVILNNGHVREELNKLKEYIVGKGNQNITQEQFEIYKKEIEQKCDQFFAKLGDFNKIDNPYYPIEDHINRYYEQHPINL